MQASSKKAIGTGLLAVFAYLAYCVVSHASWLQQFDSSLAGLVAKTVTPANSIVFKGIAFLGSPATVIGITCILCLWLWLRHGVVLSLWVGGLQLFGSAIAEVIKKVVARPRPLDQLIPDTGFSFPSGHTFCTTIFVFTILMLVLPGIKKRHCRIVATIAGIIWIGFVAMSRVYFRDHFASDVIGSILLASGYWLLITPYEIQIKKLIGKFIPERIQ